MKIEFCKCKKQDLLEIIMINEWWKSERSNIWRANTTDEIKETRS